MVCLYCCQVTLSSCVQTELWQYNRHCQLEVFPTATSKENAPTAGSGAAPSTAPLRYYTVVRKSSLKWHYEKLMIKHFIITLLVWYHPSHPAPPPQKKKRLKLREHQTLFEMSVCLEIMCEQRIRENSSQGVKRRDVLARRAHSRCVGAFIYVCVHLYRCVCMHRLDGPITIACGQ